MTVFETHVYQGNNTWDVTLYDGSVWTVTGTSFPVAIQTIPDYAQKVITYFQQYGNGGNTMVTVQIRKIGNGQVLSSGGDNALAERTTISVPSGFQITFDARPAPGEQFLKFVSAQGVETTQNPFTVPVTADGTITAYFTGQTPPMSGSSKLIGLAILGAIAYFVLKRR